MIFNRTTIFAAILFSSVLGGGLAAQATKPQVAAELSAKSIARRDLPAVVLLLCDDPATDGYTQGSGFFIKSGILVTNYHVIKGNLRGFVRVAIGPKQEKKDFRIARIVAFDEDADLALLSIPAAKEGKIPFLSLEPRGAEIGETIYALGNPEGLVGTISPGIISANLRSAQKKSRLQITAPISHGSSGGPVVNGQGNVIGVAVGSLSEGQNLNFAVPAQLVRELLTGADIPDDVLDFMDTRQDKDSKTVANWAWPKGQITETAKTTPVVSIIGPLRAGETKNIAALRKLTGVYVIIEDLSPAAKQILDQQQLKTDIELRLRRNGIRVLSASEWIQAPGGPALDVSISVLKDAERPVYTYTYTVSLNQDIRLDRDPSFKMGADTWSDGKFGFAGSSVVLSSIREGIMETIDQFCNDFLKANSP